MKWLVGIAVVAQPFLVVTAIALLVMAVRGCT